MPHLRLVLCRTAGPINLGMIARTCGNWGIDDCWLVDPQCPIDCDDTRKFANRAIDWLRRCPVVGDLNQALSDCEVAIATSARSRAGEAPLSPALLADWLTMQANSAERIALVFGNEQHGLSEAEHRACQASLRLPMPGNYQSFNLAQAVATALALWPGLADSQPTEPARTGTPAATHAQRRELIDTFTTAADAIRHLSGIEAGKRAGWHRRLEGWLLRSSINRDEANALRSFLATLLKKNASRSDRRDDRIA